MSFRDLILYLRGLCNANISRILNRRRKAAGLLPPLSLGDVLRRDGPPLMDLVRLLEGRPDAGREAMVEGYLSGRGFPFTRRPYRSLEGSGVNLEVDLGEGENLLILIAHHDAVPGSPGANDNGSSVAILLDLARRLRENPPRGVRARLLFTGGEERSYLGARCYVKEAPLEGVAGVLSLELCGIGDSLAIWDVAPPMDRSDFLGRVTAVLDGLGYRRDETYHVAGRIPLFGSDHLAFQPLGIPAFGLTLLPGSEAERLRQFIYSPGKTILKQLYRRMDVPPPFHTYHTLRDRSQTLDPAALERVRDALFALVHSY